MKEGWTYKKIKDVAKVFAGQGAPQGDSNYSLDGTPFVKAGNLSDLINGESESSIQKVSEEVAQSHKLKLYKAGSVLFAKSGMSCMKGFVYTLKSDCYVVSHLAIITPHSVNSHFLNYYLRYNKPNSLIKDEAYPSISLKDIENLQIPFPPLAEQERIVAELDLLQGIIEKKKEQLKAYDQLAQSIFYTMFGDPIDNPKGWETKKLRDVCHHITDGDHMPPPKSDNGIPFLTISNVNKDKQELDFSNTFFVPQEYYDNLKDERKARINDMLYTVTGSYGIPVIVRTSRPFCFQRHIALLKPIQEKVLTSFLFYWALCPSIKEEADSVATGIAQKTVGLNSLRQFNVILPPLSLQQEFAEKVEAIERQKALVQQSIEETQTMFDYTMDKYFG